MKTKIKKLTDNTYLESPANDNTWTGNEGEAANFNYGEFVAFAAQRPQEYTPNQLSSYVKGPQFPYIPISYDYMFSKYVLTGYVSN
jgi:hypothetical protein